MTTKIKRRSFLKTAGVGLAGWLGARFVLREPPLAVLRGNL